MNAKIAYCLPGCQRPRLFCRRRLVSVLRRVYGQVPCPETPCICHTVGISSARCVQRWYSQKNRRGSVFTDFSKYTGGTLSKTRNVGALGRGQSFTKKQNPVKNGVFMWYLIESNPAIRMFPDIGLVRTPSLMVQKHYFDMCKIFLQQKIN